MLLLSHFSISEVFRVHSYLYTVLAASVRRQYHIPRRPAVVHLSEEL